MSRPTQENRQISRADAAGRRRAPADGLLRSRRDLAAVQLTTWRCSPSDDSIEPQRDRRQERHLPASAGPTASRRYFNGFVSRFAAGDARGGAPPILRPRSFPGSGFSPAPPIAASSRTRSVPQIIEQIFQDLGFTDYETSEIKGTPRAWEYCVQYRETDFNFVSRLMEEEGHLLLLQARGGQAHAGAGRPERRLQAIARKTRSSTSTPTAGSRPRDHITSWEHHYEFTPGKWSQTDYNFIDHPARNEPTPANLMMTNEQPTGQAGQHREVRDLRLPGRLRQEGRRRRPARRSAWRRTRPRYDVVAASEHLQDVLGRRQVQVSHGTTAAAEEGKTFVITVDPASGHRAGAVRAGRRARPTTTATRFTCIPDSVTFRPRADHAQAGRPGLADGRGRRPAGRGNLARQVRPGQGPVLLGPRGQARRQQLLLDPRARRSMAGKGWGSMSHPADRPGSGRQLPRRRPRPAADHRPRLQRRPDAAVRACRGPRPSAG